MEGETSEIELVLTCRGNQQIQFSLMAEGASVTPNSGTVRPGQSVKVKLLVGADQTDGNIRIFGSGKVQTGQEVPLDTVQIPLVREIRQDTVKIDSGALDLLEGL